MNLYKNFFKIFFLFLPLWPAWSQQKAGVDFESELGVGTQKKSFDGISGIDKEIVVEGTDEYVLFSGKKEIHPELMDAPLQEKWQEKTDTILNGYAPKPVREKNGHVNFSYGNRNFFLFDALYAAKVKKTTLGVDFRNKSFSHIDTAQSKENSEQVDTDLRFFSESRISQKHMLLFSFTGYNRYNRLQSFTQYNRLDKRFLSASLLQKFYLNALSYLSLELRGNYTRGLLQKNSGESLHNQLGRFELELDWQKKMQAHEISLAFLAGYFYRREFFRSAEHPYYTFFSFSHKAKLWSTLTAKSRLPWSGNLTWQAGAGNYKKDYLALASLALQGRLAGWDSTFKVLFEKKYCQSEQDWLRYRYWLADNSEQKEEKIESFWQNQISVGEKIFMEHKLDFSYYLQTHQFFWNTDKEIWQYNSTSYYSLENRLGLLFQITPIVSWNFYLSYIHFQKKMPQLAPVQFESVFLVNAEKVTFSLRYRLVGKRFDHFQKKDTALVHLLDMSLVWKINKRFAFTLSGENLLLQKYWWLSPFSQPELTMHLGVSIRL